MELSAHGEANSLAASKIIRLLWNTHIHYRLNKKLDRTYVFIATK